MLALPLLLALNIVVWLVVLAYTFKLPPFVRRWNPWVALGAAFAALGLSIWSYQDAARQQVKSRALTHYYAGISAKQLGNLEEAEKEFDKALSLQPGDEQAQQQLQEIQQQKPAERREQRKETKVEAPPPSAQPVQPAPAGQPAAPQPKGPQPAPAHPEGTRPPPTKPP